MLKRVHTRWIEGVLQRSLEVITRMELGLAQRPDAVPTRAPLITYRLSGEGHPVPPGRSIGAVFDELEEALLILGTPGAGKTTLRPRVTQCDL